MNKKEFLKQLKEKKETALWEEKIMEKFFNRKVLAGDNQWENNLKSVKSKIKILEDLIKIINEEIKEI